MKKIVLIASSLLMLMNHVSFAGTKTLVEYGVVQQSHVITGAQNTYHPLRTVAAGAVGGVVGHQFGNGDGKKAMTAGGAVAGIASSRYQQRQQQSIQKVDLLIKMDNGQTIDVVQTLTGNMVFKPGDKVRILTRGSDTSVDKSV